MSQDLSEKFLVEKLTKSNLAVKKEAAFFGQPLCKLFAHFLNDGI